LDDVPRELKSLRGQFVRILLAVSMLMSVATISIVVLMSAQASSVHFAAVQGHIRDGIISKGKVLTEQHALALRSLALDNAFLDMQRLVERALIADPDLVYGLFVSGDLTTLAMSRHGGVHDDALPRKDDWRSLGLRQEELLVKSGSVERVMRMGRDVLEVAVPVASEEGDVLGTIRYGLSTVRMHDALAYAKRDSDSRLWRSVLLMVVLVGGVTAVGLALSRAQAVRITEPIGALRRAAETLASGDRSVRVDIQSGDELALLGMSFNRMVDELDSSYGQLELMNRTLEQKVEVRTAELARKNRDMRLVLDNVDQGLISLTANGVVVGERSAAADQWFGASDRAQSFWEYMEPLSAPFAHAFRDAWWQVEARFLPLELALCQLPAQLTRGQRAWSLRYLALPDDSGKDDSEGILIVIADVTEHLAREREEAEHGELMQISKRLIHDRNGLSCFLQEATTMVNQVVSLSDPVDIPHLKRALHTLKGNAAVMGLTIVARICHALETQLAEGERMEPSSVAELGARWAAIVNHVTTFLGASQRVVEVAEEEYAALVSRLSKSDANSEVLKALLSWQLEPAAKPLSQLGEQARSLGHRLGRGEINVIVSAEDVRLDPQYWAPFFAELVHLVRNAVDHGLEPPTERLSLGKPENGTLALRARIESDELTFEVSDDGRGIDWPGILERAKERGLPHSTQAELIDALCADGVTTRDVASDVSGRGVGMASFRQRLDTLSGRIDVQSAKGVGTSWFMRFRWPVGEVASAEYGARPACA
jgi:two-component system, chemotaxis family, sensor kinase CheA